MRVKVICRVQLFPASTFAPHIFVNTKSPWPGPEILIFRIVVAVFRVLVNVALCGELEVPTFCLPNDRADGDRPFEAPAAFAPPELPEDVLAADAFVAVTVVV